MAPRLGESAAWLSLGLPGRYGLLWVVQKPGLPGSTDQRWALRSGAPCQLPGELLIYLGSALLPLRPAPPLILLAAVLFVWYPNMSRKDQSLARDPGFQADKERGWLSRTSAL